MITQQDINKLLQNNDTFQQYVIIGQNIKSKKELINDIVNELEYDYEMFHEFQEQPYYMESWIYNFFKKSYHFTCEPVGTKKNVSFYHVCVWNMHDKIPSEVKDLHSQPEEITEDHFKLIIAKFLLTKLNEATNGN